MKVLFTGSAPLIRFGLAEGFRQAGHEVFICDNEYRLWGLAGNPEEQSQRLVRAVNKFQPDMIFSEGYAGFDAVAICRLVKEHIRIPHFYWAIEDPVATHISDTYAEFVDYLFTTTEERIPYYSGRFSIPNGVLLFGCNPEFHKNVGMHEEFKADIVLVAANYDNRYDEAEWFIMPLVKKGYNIKVWGVWWDDPYRRVNLVNNPVYQGVLPYDYLAMVYSSAKVVLGMNCDDTSMTQTSMRPYEALGCGGGLFVAHYTKAQEAIFGDLLYQPKNESETLEIVDSILAMSEEDRRERAFIAQTEVYAKHTYKIRAQQIVDAYNSVYGGK